MWESLTFGIVLGMLGRLTAGPTGPSASGDLANTPAPDRIECFTVGLVVGLLSSLPTILQYPSERIGPGLLAAYATFTTLRSEQPIRVSTRARCARWGTRALVGSLAMFAGWLVGSFAS